MKVIRILILLVMLVLGNTATAQDENQRLIYPGFTSLQNTEQENDEKIYEVKDYVTAIISIGHNYRGYCLYMSKHLNDLAFGYDGHVDFGDLADYEFLERSSRIAERVFKLCEHYLEYEKSGNAH